MLAAARTAKGLVIYACTDSRCGLMKPRLAGMECAACIQREHVAMAAFESLLRVCNSVDMPSCFITGTKDWGVYQFPGRSERMRDTACTCMLGCRLIPGAGHWVQQEHPEAVTAHLLTFFEEARRLRTA